MTNSKYHSYFSAGTEHALATLLARDYKTTIKKFNCGFGKKRKKTVTFLRQFFYATDIVIPTIRLITI